MMCRCGRWQAAGRTESRAAKGRPKMKTKEGGGAEAPSRIFDERGLWLGRRAAAGRQAEKGCRGWERTAGATRGEARAASRVENSDECRVT